MSSLVTADKDQIRNRKSVFDSSATTLPTAGIRNLRQDRLSTSRPDTGCPSGSRARPEIKPDQRLPPRESRPSARRRAEDDLGCKDFKQLYDGALAANGRLRSRLDTSKEELSLVQSQLDRVTGHQQRRRATERAANMLETEKKENRCLEKKISNMEEELKAKAELSTENQRLKDENGALIRVISKLSK